MEQALEACEHMKSLPSRERGLKFLTTHAGRAGVGVAPFTGAWIEMNGGL